MPAEIFGIQDFWLAKHDESAEAIGKSQVYSDK
jgi:hypothetical protein